MEIWLIDKASRERTCQLTPQEVEALRAYKRGSANTEQRLLSLAVLNRAKRDEFWFECGCRRVRSLRPDFHPRLNRNGEYACVNRSDKNANRLDAPLAHAEDCPFRRVDAQSPLSARLPDMLGGFDAADEDLPPPRPDPSTWPYKYWKPRPRVAAEKEDTLWGTASKLMERAGLNLLGAEERRPPPGEWLAAIVEAARSLYLPPRVPASGFLFTDHAAWRSGEVAAKLEAAARDWPGGGGPRAYLCWPVDEVSGCVVDPGGEGHVEAPGPVVCPSFGGRPVIGPYLFLGAVTRTADRWACVNACAQPIARLDCPVLVDSNYERQAVDALWRMVRTLAGNRELAALLGGALGIELEKPLTVIETTAGACLPDFLLTAFRPGAYSHLPGGPGHPRHFGRFDLRDRAHYVIEVMGRDDPEYEKSKKNTHPRMERLGPVKEMMGREFGSSDNGIDRQRKELTAEIALDLLRRWRRRDAGPAAA